MTVCWFCSLLFTLVEFVLQRKNSTQKCSRWTGIEKRIRKHGKKVSERKIRLIYSRNCWICQRICGGQQGKKLLIEGVWLIVAGRGSRVQSRGSGSNVAVAGPKSRSRVQSRGRGSNFAAGENDLGFEVTAEWKRLIWTQYKGKKSFLCTILYGTQFTGYGC